MPGSGKSATGHILAAELGLHFVDTDDVIVKKEGKQIRDIFEESGEEYFRDLETEALLDVSEQAKQVVATGGGIILKDYNWEIMKKWGKVIYLKTSVDWILKRTSYSDKRPLLNQQNREKAVRDLYDKREPIYEKADFVCTTDNKTPKQVAKEIESYLNEKNIS
jgi:shikimate kinase